VVLVVGGDGLLKPNLLICFADEFGGDSAWIDPRSAL
jgi:hypothetical protein